MHFHTRVMISLLVFVLVISSFRCCFGWSEQKQISPRARLLVQDALHFSKQASGNITAAFVACDRWKQLSCFDLPETIRAMCLPLQASCLVRVGDDQAALDVYAQSMDLVHLLNREAREDVIIGRAYSYQRLMKYDEARLQFQKSNSSEAALGAATCALRTGDIDVAGSILETFLGQPDLDEDHAEVKALLATVRYLNVSSADESSIRSILNEAAPVFPLYRWILSTITRAPITDASVPTDLLSLASLNTGAFDDPLLVHLDDKVLLHQLLSDSSSSSGAFWPPGYILPTETSQLSQQMQGSNVSWICKQRAGYGSHGNSIVSAKEALSLANTLSDDILLQKMVEPPLLLKDRKFSLRIYVICFGASVAGSSPAEVHISTHGLVKLAMERLEQDGTQSTMGMHMTNSGREVSALQEDLKYLEDVFVQAGWSFARLWDDIRKAVTSVLQAYEIKTLEIVKEDEKMRIFRDRLAKLGLPKILGFDFVVDEARNPWLVEVNRFPGLEPRDTQDERIKHQVVRDAWRAAARRSGFESEPWVVMAPSIIDEESSLQRLEL